jgi:CheY-like chemotaxis protein
VHLDFLSYRIKEQKLGLIISDVNLPSANNVSFIDSVKFSAEHKSTPFVMFLDGWINSSREQAVPAGVTAWLIKPFDKAQLLEVISRFGLPELVLNSGT